MSLCCHLCGTPVAEREVQHDRAYCLACGNGFALDGRPGAPIPLPSDDPLPQTIERHWDHQETPSVGVYRDSPRHGTAHPKGLAMRVRPWGHACWRRMTLDASGFTFAWGLRRLAVPVAAIHDFEATRTWREQRLTEEQRANHVRPREYVRYFLSLRETNGRCRRLLSTSQDAETLGRTAELLKYQLAVLRSG